MPRIKDERYEQIVSDYLSGMNQKDVEKKNGLYRGSVHNIIVARGITPRSYTGDRISNKKWEWNHNFFYDRTPLVAYWAGFLMADGSLITNGGHSTLVLVLKDKEHVLSFCDAVGVNREIVYKVKNKEHYGLHLNYYGLPEQLKPWGIVPRKTYEYVEPQVGDELLPHYLRGWADGDGSIYSYGRSARFTLCGNNPALLWYSEALRKIGFTGHIGIHPHHKSTEFSDIYIGGKNHVNEIRKLLLVDDSFKLERRWNVRYEDRRITVTNHCLYCGKPFEVPKYRHENEPQNGKFCNRKCWVDSMHKKENKNV